MEFYLKDCITGEYKGFTSMKDLARFWLRKFDKRFDQLNLTGKDILTETVFTGMTLSRNGLPIPNYEHRRTLRRRRREMERNQQDQAEGRLAPKHSAKGGRRRCSQSPNCF